MDSKSPATDDASEAGGAVRPRYYKILNEFVDDGSLASVKTLGELKVWLVLKRYEKNGVAWPSLGTIALKAGMSRGNVSRAIKSLNASGLVSKVTSGRGRYRSSRYTIANSVPGATLKLAYVVPGAAPIAAYAQLQCRPGRNSNSVPGAPPQRPCIKPSDKDHQQHHAPARGRIGHDGGDNHLNRSEEEAEEERLTRAMLAQFHVWPEVIDELIVKFPGLTHDIVADVARNVSRRVENIGAVLAKRLRVETPRLIEQRAERMKMILTQRQEQALLAAAREKLLREAADEYAANVDTFEGWKVRLWPSEYNQRTEVENDARGAMVDAGVATRDEPLDWKSMARGGVLVLAVKYRRQLNDIIDRNRSIIAAGSRSASGPPDRKQPRHRGIEENLSL